jgi:hypothetical protein
VLQLVWENQACKWWEFSGLISHKGIRDHSPMALLQAQDNKALGQWKFWGPTSCMGLRELSSKVLLRGEPFLLACAFWYLWSSGSRGTCLHRGTGVPDISPSHVLGGECVTPCSCVCSEAGLIANLMPSNGAWSCTETSGVGNQDC